MHLGIAHEEERVLTARPLSPVNNILSQSVADIAQPSSRGLSFLGEAQRFQGDPSIQAGATTLGRGIQPPSALDTLRGSEATGTVISTDPAERIKSRTRLAEEAEVFIPSGDNIPSRGLDTTPTAPVLGKIDFSSIEGLIKGVGSVAEFTRNLQKFNRSRGITPGKKGKAIKTSDIQNRIKFLQSQLNEGIVTEEQEAGVTDELDILNQFIQSRLGVGATRATRAREDEQRRLDLEAIRAS